MVVAGQTGPPAPLIFIELGAVIAIPVAEALSLFSAIGIIVDAKTTITENKEVLFKDLGTNLSNSEN
jgi:hypothetical protein